jgi:hypothetical protein
VKGYYCDKQIDYFLYNDDCHKLALSWVMLSVRGCVARHTNKMCFVQHSRKTKTEDALLHGLNTTQPLKNYENQIELLIHVIF